MGVEAAILSASAISAGAGLISSSQASSAQQDAAKSANKTELAMYNQSREDTAPWRTAGTQAINALMGTQQLPDREAIAADVINQWRTAEGKVWNPARGMYVRAADSSKLKNKDDAYLKDYFSSWIDYEYENQKANAPREGGLIPQGPGEFTESPGYEFRRDEGEKAIQRAAAASGNLGGAQLKALTRYNQDYASNEYQNFLNQYYQSLNPMLSMAGMGQVSAGQTASQGMQAGQSMANNSLYAGNARASGYINNANAITGGIQSGVNNYLTYSSLPNYGGVNNIPGGQSNPGWNQAINY